MLVSLKELSVYSNGVTSLPTEIGLCVSLTALELWDNEIAQEIPSQVGPNELRCAHTNPEVNTHTIVG
jgi:Leucine-rich repeat (LRR) protein